MLKARVFTALLGIPVLLFFVYLGNYWFTLFILLAALLGLKEYNAMMKKGNWRPFELAGYLVIPLIFFAIYQESPSLLISLWVLFFITFSLLPVFFYGRVKYWDSAIAFWGIIYTGGLAGYLVATRMLPGGFYYILFLLIVIWSNDVFAYLWGSRYGRRLLAPAISPKKTMEGMIAGLLASMSAGIVLALFIPDDLISIQMGISLGFLTGLTGTLGDLTQSALKRSAGVKDSGDLLPGHGGILDRFDSLFFAAPFFYIYSYYFMV